MAFLQVHDRGEFGSKATIVGGQVAFPRLEESKRGGHNRSTQVGLDRWMPRSCGLDLAQRDLGRGRQSSFTTIVRAKTVLGLHMIWIIQRSDLKASILS